MENGDDYMKDEVSFDNYTLFVFEHGMRGDHRFLVRGQ
jgi:hypothetical protein